MNIEKIKAIGRRKTSRAIVFLEKGTGSKCTIEVNNQNYQDYFDDKFLNYSILTPFKLTNTNNMFNVFARISGGGTSSQAQALIHGISLTLAKTSEEYRKVLKKEGLLSFDSRQKERRKCGLKKARKAPQFSKR